MRGRVVLRQEHHEVDREVRQEREVRLRAHRPRGDRVGDLQAEGYLQMEAEGYLKEVTQVHGKTWVMNPSHQSS